MRRLAIALAFLAAPAAADGVTPVPTVMLCGPARYVDDSLTANGEMKVARALVGSENGPKLLTRLWVNPKTRAWTLTNTDAAGKTTCMVAAGTDFEADFAAKGQGS